ncbi:hypothetical protein GR925_25900 [Streptomyces sp. HUCO-GS316]|uniref:hypothetical protein n=1 Tax=Streptomyces sp. HUCO-GS316 TaxID=2692198 RepID=UPI00136A6185|nr:hypothetical protein [Streptomyces sp. HUCO-GS316]MXM66771.1 hypothetical protein [Streptomyces sp. HUCO-GS316]
MSGQERPERVEDWEPVRSRLLTIADRLEQGGEEEPARMSTVLDLADELSKDTTPYVLAGLVVLLPNTYPGETCGEYAARLREAVTD